MNKYMNKYNNVKSISEYWNPNHDITISNLIDILIQIRDDYGECVIVLDSGYNSISSHIITRPEAKLVRGE